MISMQEYVSRIAPGRYIVAVSGGVDSMVLLDVLRQQPQLELVVAHVNHGIRPDAKNDGEIIERVCASHNIAYTHVALHLAVTASEEAARRARYAFLRKCLSQYDAKAIITAHHQDDMVETVLINIMRGTGWRGLAPFTESQDLLRPLIDIRKNQLLAYAAHHHVVWREDTTNMGQTYLRNYIRHTAVPFLNEQTPGWRMAIMRHIRNQQHLRRTIEDELKVLLTSTVRFEKKIAVGHRYVWIMMADTTSYELFQALCRQLLGNSLVRELTEAAVLFIKTARPGKAMLLNTHWQLRVTTTEFIVEQRLVVVQ